MNLCLVILTSEPPKTLITDPVWAVLSFKEVPFIEKAESVTTFITPPDLNALLENSAELKILAVELLSRWIAPPL